MIAFLSSWGYLLHPYVGNGYQFWSGIGSDIGEVAIIGGLISIYRKGNCHQQHCWRMSHHDYEVDGVTYRLCHKHHPSANETLTSAQVQTQHKRNVRQAAIDDSTST
jgi:hypothetical protein